MTTPYGAFASAVTDGAECDELFELLEAIPKGTPERDQAIQDLRRLGCYGRQQHRRQDGDVLEQYAVHDYRGHYQSVAQRPENVYEGARTVDVDVAARWYAAQFEGVVAEAAHVACLDALNGRPPRH